MIIDTHAHLNFDVFDKDREKIIEKCHKNKVWVVNVGINFETSKKAVEIAERYKGMFASIGLHPLNLDTGLVKTKNEKERLEKTFDYQKYKKLTKNPKVIAIGEIGLDYYLKPKTKRRREIFKTKQKKLLFEELKLAKKLNLPVIFHCRMAHLDLIQFLKENKEVCPKKAVLHSFVGKIEELKEYLNFGYNIGFNGIIFKKIEGIDFEKIIKVAPLEKILVETDAPYLTPPQVKEKRNEPIFVKYIIKRIADIKNLEFEKVAEITFENAKKLFKIENS
ncbi:TatD family hydrolase [bacterium]|nr:TatD family hydrolase [bacterium]